VLLDIRKSGKFKGRGALADAARELLLPAWRTGSASEVREAMQQFRAEYNDALLQQSSVEPRSEQYQQWTVELGRWLYSTEHIKVQYSIEYDGVAITQLSPGTRGIVLLLLYLALDLEDSRPLLIDQPEENLDPKSVYSELVSLFRDARLRRQVIIVTHNANLVVNTDVDQVIVASCVRTESGTAPIFEYLSGGLEDPQIREQVCEILEGGEAAFKQRAKRLRVGIGV
jgi:predicted ATP-dependent endonuclease of OLD family